MLILGNSHTGAPHLRCAIDPPLADFAPDIFRDARRRPDHALGRGRVLVTRDADARRKMVYYCGIPDLPVAGYDAFVVISGLALYQLAALERASSLDFPTQRAGPRLHAGLDRICRYDAATYDRSPALRMRLLAGLGQGPVLFIDQMFPSAECRQARKTTDYVALAGH